MTLVLLASLAHAATVEDDFPPPTGAVRVDTDAFGDWLRTRPLGSVDEPIRSWRGEILVGHAARVIELPLVPGDLQQCADSAIRLRAEWLHELGAPVSFHATSGDPIPWSRMQSGETPRAVDGHLVWSPGAPASWDHYLGRVFTWAGTRSLAAYDTVAADSPRGGDVLVSPGSPGHAVLLLDVASSGATTWVLVGEGYMPAQTFHVELGPTGGWWAWEDGVLLPHWDLRGDTLRRWKP